MNFFIDLSVLRRNRRFRLLFSGQFVSFFGTMITSVALPYQIYQLTHSTLMVGLISLFQLLPLLVTALLGGVFADRYHRRMMLIIAESLLGLSCLGLAYNAALAAPHVWLIFIVAPFMSALTGLHRPSMDSIKQEIVAKEDFPMVGTLATFMYSITMIGGPAAGGLIISHYGIVATFVIDFLTYLFALGTVFGIGEVPRHKVVSDLSTWQSLKEGISYASSRQELLGTYLIDFIAMIFGMPLALFPAIAQLQGGAQTLGMLYSAPAVGALFISIFGGWVTHVKRHGVAIALSAIAWGVAIIFFGLEKNFMLSLFFLALAGAADALSGIFRQTMWNNTIPNQYRGRLSGIEMISYLSGPKLGDTEAGLVAAAFGITASVVSGGVLCVAGVIIGCYFMPKFWKYHSDAPS
jgi:MFS family permease